MIFRMVHPHSHFCTFIIIAVCYNIPVDHALGILRAGLGMSRAVRFWARRGRYPRGAGVYNYVVCQCDRDGARGMMRMRTPTYH